MTRSPSFPIAAFLIAAFTVAAVSAGAPSILRAADPPPEEKEKTIEERRDEERKREEKIRERLTDARKAWRDIQAEHRRDLANKPRSVRLRAARRTQRDDAFERRALARFHARLAAFARNKRRGDRLVILQLGDSHSAADHLSGFLREVFQRRFGDAGRGMLAPGKPFRYYSPYRAEVKQSDGWAVDSSRRTADLGPFGIAGYSITGLEPEDTIKLDMRGLQTFDNVEIEYLTSPNGGKFVVEVDGFILDEINTRSGRAGPRRFVRRVKANARKLSIRPSGDGKVQLLSWSVYRSKGGVVYINHGVAGETIRILGRWDPKIAKWQLDRLDPALILVAFGTNEGFDHKLKLDDYARDFEDRLTELRRLAPRATIVIVGAPDAARLPSWCGRSRKRRERYKCYPLSKTKAANYARLIDKRSRSLCHWHSPPTLSEVRAIQKRIARRLGLVYWDWSKVMGGHCGMDRWARKDEPLAYADRVHMTYRGYDISGQALYEELMRHYKGR